jgi:hypothetical protein
LKDYRRTTKGNLKFSLNEIIFLTLSAVISGFNTYELIAELGVDFELFVLKIINAQENINELMKNTLDLLSLSNNKAA